MLNHIKTGLKCGFVWGLLFLILEDLTALAINNINFTLKQVIYSIVIYPLLSSVLGGIIALLIFSIRLRFDHSDNSERSCKGLIIFILSGVALVFLGYRDFTNTVFYQGGNVQLLVATVWGISTLVTYLAADWLIRRSKTDNCYFRDTHRMAFGAAMTSLLIIFIRIDYDPTLTADIASVELLYRLIALCFAIGIYCITYHIARKMSDAAAVTIRRKANIKTLVLGFVLLVISAYALIAIPNRREVSPIPRDTYSSKPNIILIIIDTLRADHLKTYGYHRDTSPWLTQQSREGTIFEDVLAASSWTKPSVASIFTGRYSAMNGADSREDLLPSELVTLAETLSGNGYFTAGINTNSFVTSTYNYDQGFDEYRYLPGHGPKQLILPHFLFTSRDAKIREVLYNIGFIDGGLIYGKADEVTRMSINWLEERGTDPFFLYMHYMDVHYPYYPVNRKFSSDDRFSAAELRIIEDLFQRRSDELVDSTLVKRMIDRYDDEITNIDSGIKDLFAALSSLQLMENTLIVITSDHGEEFTEHGHFDHGHTMYSELLKIPLIMFFPESEYDGLVIPRRVDLLDVAPTIYEYAGITPNEKLEGTSLLPLLRGEDEIYDSLKKGYFGYVIPPWDELLDESIYALVNNRYKLVKVQPNDSTLKTQLELYDVFADPGDMHDISDSLPDLTLGMWDEMREFRKYCDSLKVTSGEELQQPLSPEDMERLRGLGYVQ
ncbi:hypothetical protein CEE37_06535 [candidate division LCP-89 bacterium B3_LCP]|uniref:Sulfatase N-terminal domain-containing protein n=1 Tax=candidate division LCP-89 bacterium B3_LCP TaxID=2012998 RepID=A0A532V0X9_UNCL8|nr:MAG: hypothetical protein CEE37_06535 [candidate division LCP-89 bacterium B3_LCP]